LKPVETIFPTVHLFQSTARLLGSGQSLPIILPTSSAELTRIDLRSIAWNRLPNSEKAWVIELNALDTQTRNPIKELQRMGIVDHHGLPLNYDKVKRGH